MNKCKNAHTVRSGIRNEARGGGANIEALAYSAPQCGLTMRSEWRALRRSEPTRCVMRPEPRQYTVADLERARDRVAAAERRIDNDRRSNPNRGRAGLERAQLELSVIESQLRLRGPP